LRGTGFFFEKQKRTTMFEHRKKIFAVFIAMSRSRIIVVSPHRVQETCGELTV